MTAVSQIVKSLPHGWIQLPDFFNWFRQLPRHSGTPCYGIVFGNIPPFEGTLPLLNLDLLLFMSIAALISGTWIPNSGPSSTSVSLNWAHTSTQANSTLRCGPFAQL